MEVGFDIFLWGMNKPIKPFRYDINIVGDIVNTITGEVCSNNFFPLTDFDEAKAIKLRVLGLRIYHEEAREAEEVNGIIVKYPYVYKHLLIDAYPLDVRDREQMLLFHKIAALNVMQYKYIALRTKNIDTEPERLYFIESRFPKDYAMLISSTEGFNPTFDYEKAQRSFQIPVRSYFPVRQFQQLELETDWSDIG